MKPIPITRQLDIKAAKLNFSAAFEVEHNEKTTSSGDWGGVDMEAGWNLAYVLPKYARHSFVDRLHFEVDT